jgi:hypothetical protein
MKNKADFLAMKPEQRTLVSQAIVIAGLAVSEHGGNGHIWRETMRRRALGGVGRVRRFYRYLSSFNDRQIELFLNGFTGEL